MSHNDKRTPHTDALETLGMIHQHDENVMLSTWVLNQWKQVNNWL